MRKSLHIILLLSLLLLGTGCRKKVEMDLDMYNSEQVSLMVKGKKVFSFDEGAGQLAYNRALQQFRAGNDDMTSFFVITCSELPRQEEQEIIADIQWTSGSSLKTSRGIRLKVEKYDGTGLVWLWNAADKTGAVVKILN